MEHESIFEKNISEHLKVADMGVRIALFTEWLLKRPENCVVVVGHSAFFRDMLNTELKLKNCEVRSCTMKSDGTFEEGAVTIIAGGDELLQTQEEKEEGQEQKEDGEEQEKEKARKVKF